MRRRLDVDVARLALEAGRDDPVDEADGVVAHRARVARAVLLGDGLELEGIGIDARAAGLLRARVVQQLEPD